MYHIKKYFKGIWKWIKDAFLSADVKAKNSLQTCPDFQYKESRHHIKNVTITSIQLHQLNFIEFIANKRKKKVFSTLFSGGKTFKYHYLLQKALVFFYFVKPNNICSKNWGQLYRCFVVDGHKYIRMLGGGKLETAVTPWAYHWNVTWQTESVKGIFSDSNNIFLWYQSEDINKKKLISKISDDFNFLFSSYAWLCVFHCSHRLLCWINSRVREFSVKIALISYWNASSQIPLGECAS